MTLSSCSPSMAPKFTRGRNLIAGFISGWFSIFPLISDTRRNILFREDLYQVQITPRTQIHLYSLVSIILQHCRRKGSRFGKASLNQVVNSNLFLTFFTADGVGLTELNGFAGHMAALGCRKYCGVKGRRKPGASNTIQPILSHWIMMWRAVNHKDVDIWDLAAKLGPTHEKYQQNLAYLLESRNTTQYNERRLETGPIKTKSLSWYCIKLQA